MIVICYVRHSTVIVTDGAQIQRAPQRPVAAVPIARRRRLTMSSTATAVVGCRTTAAALSSLMRYDHHALASPAPGTRGVSCARQRPRRPQVWYCGSSSSSWSDDCPIAAYHSCVMFAGDSDMDFGTTASMRMDALAAIDMKISMSTGQVRALQHVALRTVDVCSSGVSLIAYWGPGAAAAHIGTFKRDHRIARTGSGCSNKRTLGNYMHSAARWPQPAAARDTR